MARLIAIDYGTKRCGIAVTDPMQIIATALDVIHPDSIIKYLQDYARSEEIEGFVIGLPLHADGSDMDLTRVVKKFGARLKKEFPSVHVHFEDERYTSKMAAETMIIADFKKKDRRKKENLDKISAVLILQSFMEKDMK